MSFSNIFSEYGLLGKHMLRLGLPTPKVEKLNLTVSNDF